MTAGGARRLTRCLADECEHSSAGPRVQSEIVGRSRGIALRYGGRERERPSNLPHGERWPEPSKRAQGGVSIIEEERLRSSSMIGAPHQQAKPAAISRFAFLVGLAPFASLRLCAFAPLRLCVESSAHGPIKRGTSVHSVGFSGGDSDTGSCRTMEREAHHAPWRGPSWWPMGPPSPTKLRGRTLVPATRPLRPQGACDPHGKGRWPRPLV
jgi:hypothetical protein